MPAQRRGFLYGIVQGGWPLGVLLAAAVFLGLNNGAGWNWHYVFLLGVAPMAMVIIGRRWVRPSERYQHVRELKEAKAAGDEPRVQELLERPVPHPLPRVLEDERARAAAHRVGDRLRLLRHRRLAGRAVQAPARPGGERDGGGRAQRRVLLRHRESHRLGPLHPPLPGHERHLVRDGYAYWAESFPTRVRGTAVGWLEAMFTAG